MVTLTDLTKQITELNQQVEKQSAAILSRLELLSTKLRLFNLDALRDIIEKNHPVQIFMDDTTFDHFNSIIFPSKSQLFEKFEYIAYHNCIIRPEPSLTILRELTGLSVIVGIRLDNSIYVEGLILKP